MRKIITCLLPLFFSKIVIAQNNTVEIITPTVLKGVAAAFGFVWFMIIFLFLIISALGIALSVFWIFMLIDCAKREFKNNNDKIVWIIIIALLNWMGALVYYFAVKKQDKQDVKK